MSFWVVNPVGEGRFSLLSLNSMAITVRGSDVNGGGALALASRQGESRLAQQRPV